MEKPFVRAEILLPGEGTPVGTWASLACDQFTSEPDYWRRAEALVKDTPSTLHITLPEAYLGRGEPAARVEAIHKTMAEYKKSVLTRRVDGFVYVERTTKSGVRAGLVGAVDLEAYSFTPGAACLVRPSERTVADRIPPRLAVRRGAPLETPHILMLADDPAQTVVERVGAKRDRLQKLYEGDLMLGGGHIAGWAVTQESFIDAIERAAAELGAQAAFDQKYPAAKGRAPFALAVGDGNHSLAAAKAYWEELKPTLSEARRAAHPARYCLAELVNVYDPALVFEPVHRAVFETELEDFVGAFTVWLKEGGASFCVAGEAGAQVFRILDDDEAQTLAVQNAPRPLAAGTLDAFLTYFCAAHPAARVDYIHGEASVRALAGQGAVGVLLPEFEKSGLFGGVALGGVLPKKTFSMGAAAEKRYYLECRAL